MGGKHGLTALQDKQAEVKVLYNYKFLYSYIV